MSDRQKNDRKTVERVRGRFAAGNRIAKGRPPGTLNRRTLLGRELLSALERGDLEEGGTLLPARERWTRLLQSEDERTRLDAERFVWSALYGKPRSDEDDGTPGKLLIEYVNDWREVTPR
jgi:hypothetical protein